MENQETQKNEEGEVLINLPIHVPPSQKDASINIESHSLLSMSSQKGMDIENSSQPEARNIGEGTKFKHTTPYVRKKKGNKEPNALGDHTQAITKALSFEDVPTFSITVDASQVNAEMQPHSLSIHPSSPLHSSSQISSDVFRIDNMEISNSPSLKLMGEPKTSIDTHHFKESDLLEYQSFVSTMLVDLVLEQQKSLSQQSSINVTSTDSHPSMPNTLIDIPSMDTHYPLTVLHRWISPIHQILLFQTTSFLPWAQHLMNN